MTESNEPDALSLMDAVLQWSGEDLVEAVRTEERHFTPYEIASLTGLPRLVPDHELSKPTRTRWMSGPTDFTLLLAAWGALDTDFRQRLARSEMHLVGHEADAALSSAPVAIPKAWIYECKFEIKSSALRIGKKRFVGVTVLRGAPPTVVSGPTVQPGKNATATNVTELSDDDILELLEEHGRRVIANKDAKLIAPGKISLMPLIAGKMRYRADHGELLSKLVDEASWLANWIASKVSFHQVPTEQTIAKVLGREYQALKTRSNPTIQPFKD